MTLENPEYRDHEFNIVEICSKILRLTNLENFYLFISFNSGIQSLSKIKDKKKIESCQRICEYLEEKMDDLWITDSRVKLLEIFKFPNFCEDMYT